MKRLLLLILSFSISLLFMGCASNHNQAIQENSTHESWMHEIETNPNRWTRGASNWFLTGDPTLVSQENKHVPIMDAMSTTQVAVSNFSDIKIDGAFQVQIFGTDSRNSLFINGPNDAVRQVAVELHHNVLYIHQVEKISPSRMARVIVRIGVKNLRTLTQFGCGPIEAIQIYSKDLRIRTAPSATGNIYLSGNVNLTRVSQRGHGSINVFGANTPELDIESNGWGEINICGNVGVRCILHHGCGDVNIIGVNTDALTINTDGKGKIGLKGVANLKKVIARGQTCVYLSASQSKNIYACLYDEARIGVAGITTDLTVNAYHESNFYGRYLCAQNAYVKAKNQAHINVSANSKIFASVTQNSSIYYFGPPNILSKFVSPNGVIVPIWNGVGNSACLIATPVSPRIYKR